MASIPTTSTSPIWRSGWLGRQKVQQAIFASLVLGPMVVAFLLFWVYPFLGGIWGGFTLWKAFDPNQPFVGLRHYRGLMADPIFITAMKNTFFYALMYLPTGIVLALTLAQVRFLRTNWSY
jgi:ABC-type sugar transport system permease subunit